jgi:RHS repeat-associated protein
VRKVKAAATPTIYPNQFYTDFGGGSGNQFKHIFIGSERILTKKTRIAPDREHWYYHGDHLHSTAMVTNEKSQLVDAVHYFPYGEVWLEERPSSLPADYFFTAKEFDPETGFYDFGARYLDPRFSKWMTADPALATYLPGTGKSVANRSPSLANNWRSNPDLPGRGGAFQPQNLAAYTYGHSNPATLIDRDGNVTGEKVAIGCAVTIEVGCWEGALAGALVEAGEWTLIALGLIGAGTAVVVTSQSSSSKKDDPVPAARASRFPGDNGGPVMEPPGRPPNKPDPNLALTAGALAAAFVASQTIRTGDVQENEVTTFKSFNDRSRPGDNLEGHELWQQANLNEYGLSTTRRLSTDASKQNPVIALTRGIHRQVTTEQGKLNARAMTPIENIRANAQILRDLNAAPPNVINDAEMRAIQHAQSLGFR